MGQIMYVFEASKGRDLHIQLPSIKLNNERQTVEKTIPPFHDSLGLQRLKDIFTNFLPNSFGSK
jgi:hypothetical protein